MGKLVNLGEPAFNSALAYLERIDKLKKVVHEFSIGRDFEGMFYGVLELQSEIIPRLRKLKLKAEETKIVGLQQNCETLLIVPAKNKYQDLLYKKQLMTWFLEVSTLIHSMGLEMPESDKGLGAEDMV